MQLRILLYLQIFFSFCILILVAASRSEEYHDRWVNRKVGAKTYMITDGVGGGGGTGFSIAGKSGKPLIVTNDHICDGVKSGSLTVTDRSGKVTTRKILFRSDYTDLCLLEGSSEDSTLYLSEVKPEVNDQVLVVGHPRLRPLSNAKGDVVAINDSVDFTEKNDKVCDKPKNYKETKKPGNPINNLFEILNGEAVSDFICHIQINNVVMTTVVIYGGNSGSPVVNWWGDVVGIVFATDTSTNFGYFIPAEEIAFLLEKY